VIPIEGIAIGRHPNPTLCRLREPSLRREVGRAHLEYKTQAGTENVGICPGYCY